MSGLFTPRVNRSWSCATANIASAVFFWEWLRYFESHVGFDFVGYGTDKVQGGTEPPDAWKDWLPHEPDLESVPVSMGDNSWFVVEAKNADAMLDGGGSHAWQIKFQYTSSTGFDDCNVADIDYGEETTLNIVAVRANAVGGWNGTSLDFAPVGGEESSDNYLIWNGEDRRFFLDIIGDDDTIFYKGACMENTGGPVEARARTRGGYFGMLQRRSAAIAVPFFMKIGRLANIAQGTGRDAGNSRYDGNSYAEWDGSAYWNRGVKWPSYSLWKDGTRVTKHHHDTWDSFSLPLMCIDPITGDDVVPAMLVAQKENPKKHGIIGEYRFIGATHTKHAQHALFGDDLEWQEICRDIVAYGGGIAMRWPEGVVPIW